MIKIFQSTSYENKLNLFYLTHYKDLYQKYDEWVLVPNIEIIICVSLGYGGLKKCYSCAIGMQIPTSPVPYK